MQQPGFVVAWPAMSLPPTPPTPTDTGEDLFMAGARGERVCEVQAADLTTSLVTTPTILIDRFAAGTIFVPSGSLITSLTFYAAFGTGGSFLAAYDSAGNALTMTVAANHAYQLPAALFGSGQIKIVTDHDGTVEFSFKS